jgi:hypothetical protein
MNPAVPVINIFIFFGGWWFGGWRLVVGGWSFSLEVHKVHKVRKFYFLLSTFTLHFRFSIIFFRPHLIIGTPDLCRERAVRQKTSCLNRRQAVSYLSFSEQAAIRSMRRCNLDLFCILFYIKAKKNVGFGATPQESIQNG